jgi:tetratricopeptide (TPR) repeat protein
MEKAGDHMHLGLIRLRLGEALIHLDRPSEAVSLLEPYVASTAHVRGWVLRVLGQAHLAEGRPDEAVANLREAVSIFRKLGVPADEARARTSLSRLTDRLELA